MKHMESIYSLIETNKLWQFPKSLQGMIHLAKEPYMITSWVWETWERMSPARTEFSCNKKWYHQPRLWQKTELISVTWLTFFSQLIVGWTVVNWCFFKDESSSSILSGSEIAQNLHIHVSGTSDTYRPIEEGNKGLKGNAEINIMHQVKLQDTLLNHIKFSCITYGVKWNVPSFTLDAHGELVVL